jgi:hypothetical protein
MRSLFTVAALAAGFVPQAGADGPPANLSDAIHDAVAARRVETTGIAPERAGFRDVATDGAVLVGLEVGLAKWFDNDIPYTLRPIFRRGNREWTGAPAGNLSSKDVKRTVRVVAKPGYAVGGIWVRSGAALDRLCFVYVRVGETGLDPSDHYNSPWIGTSDGGGDHYIDGEGQPIVGLVADANQGQVRQMGLVVAKVPPMKRPEPKREPAAKQAPDPADNAPGAARLNEQAPVEEVEDNSLAIILLAVSAAIGIPVGLVCLMSLGKKERRPVILELDRERPRKNRKPVDQPPAEENKPKPVERPELARRLSPYLPATPVAVAGLETANGESPPYFLVRATYRTRRERMTRIYVLASELLIIDAGPGSDVNEVAGVAAAVAVGGGVIGSLIGSAVGSMVADAGKAKGEAIQARLNRLDLAGLLETAAKDGNLRVRIQDLVGVSIDPPAAPSYWRERSRAVGTFRFRDLKRGEFTFEFLLGAEVRGAIDLLRRVLGKSLHVGQGWDEATAVYLNGA